MFILSDDLLENCCEQLRTCALQPKLFCLNKTARAVAAEQSHGLLDGFPVSCRTWCNNPPPSVSEDQAQALVSSSLLWSS